MSGGFGGFGWLGQHWLAAASDPVQAAINAILALGPAVFYYNTYTVDAGNAETGDQVSQWTDLTTNARHATQSTQNDQPTVASVGPEYSFTFDAADGTNGDTLSLPTAPYSGASALTVFAALRRNGRAAAHEGPYSSNSSNWRWSFTSTTTDAFRLYAGGGTTYGIFSGLTFNATDQFCCVRYDGSGVDNAAKLKLYTANVERTASSFVGTIPATIPTITTIQMARNGASTAPGALTVYLYLVFASALSDADRTTVDTHCKTLLSWY